MNPHLKDDPTWTHFDAVPHDHIELVGDWAKIELPTGSVSELWLGDVIEHIPVWDINTVLGEWNRILKIGGIVGGTTPNLEHFIRAYINKRHDMTYDWFMTHLYGWRTSQYEQHYQTFNRAHLIETLEMMGLGEIDLSQSPGNDYPPEPWWWVFKAKKVRNIPWRSDAP